MAKRQTAPSDKFRQGRTVVLRESLVHVTGDAASALVFGQMVYWQERAKRLDGWFWKSAAELSDEMCMLFRETKVRDLLKQLVDMELLERRKDAARGKNRYLYRVLQDELDRRLATFVPGEKPPAPHADTTRATRGSYRDYSKEDLSKIEKTDLLHEKKKDSPSPAVKGNSPPAVTPDGRPLSVYRQAAERALLQGVALANAVIYRRAKTELNRGKPFDNVFGAQPAVAWTKQEDGYLLDIAQFCHEQWSDTDCVKMTAALVRLAFHPQGKPFTVLKYWLKYANGRITLHPWVAIGKQDGQPASDFLRELAVTRPVARATRELANNADADSEPRN